MKPTRLSTRVLVLLSVFGGSLLLGLGGCHRPAGSQEAATFRIMTYNIHHGEGLDGKVELERIAELIRRERANIVALQELDKGVARTGQRDLPAELAALTGMSCLFSNNFHFQGGEYGNALLTHFPIERWTNTHLARLTPGEQRGILQATLRIHGRELVVLVTHLDNRSQSERLLSANQIQQLVQPDQRWPLLLCGDFNATPGSGTYQKIAETFADSWLLAGAGSGATVPAANPEQRIDYIWLSRTNSLSARRVWVPRSNASDHLPVVAEFQFR